MKTYKDILLAQVDDIENLFNTIFAENNICQIIEIGTNRGGLSILLSDIARAKHVVSMVGQQDQRVVGSLYKTLYNNMV
jgi:hypothetical protein